jgi:polysaccharide deacetylase family protein (PEP-CTERM system associated)
MSVKQQLAGSERICNAMSIDVEDYFHVAALAGSVDRSDWDRMEYRAESNTTRLLEILSDHGICATFFVLGWVALRSPNLVREIHRAGHEVASHGMSHKPVFRQSHAEFTQETRDSKALLEDLIGEHVAGYRAATYSITQRSLWALDVIRDLGFQYDSSIFPIRHDLYGIPDAPLRPNWMGTPSGSTIVEFPMSTVDFLGVRMPVSGGGYFRLLPYWLSKAGLRKLNHQLNVPFVFYLHPWEIDPGQPVIKVGLKSRFRHYTNLSVCEDRFRTLLRDFSFTTVKDVLSQRGFIENADSKR